MLSIGVDVSKKDLVIRSYDGNNFSEEIKINNSIRALKKYFKNLEDIEKITIEATGTYHLKATYVAKECGFKVSVVDPYKVKQYAKYTAKRAKTDKIDAAIIAEYGYETETKEFEIPNKERTKLKTLLVASEGYKKQKSQLRGMIESFNQYPYGEGREMIKNLEETIEYLNVKLKEIEKEMDKILKKNYKENYGLLTSIMGIGLKISAAIIAYCDDFRDFSNAKKVVAFCGLDPSIHKSGKSVNKKSNISKRGNKILRTLLYEGAQSASIHNKQCKNLKKRLKSKNRNNKHIKVAIAHKLLRQAYGVITNGVKYDPNYVKNNV